MHGDDFCRYLVKIEKVTQRGKSFWEASVADIPGVIIQSGTLGEALSAMEEVRSNWIESKKKGEEKHESETTRIPGGYPRHPRRL